MLRQLGFTLIELMLSLALGLILSAAAIFLFLSGQKSYLIQLGLLNNQDNANFGMNYLIKDIQLANLNNPIGGISDQTAVGGIVLTSSLNATKDALKTPQSNLFRTIVGTTANVNLLSRSAESSAGTAPAWTGVSNVQNREGDLRSDQLVIQYIPQYKKDDMGTANELDDVWRGGFDCEGRELTFRINNPGNGDPFGRQVVVQRYFLREDVNAVPNTEPNRPLALVCDSGIYAADTRTNPTTILGYGGTGEIVMSRAEYLRILLTVQNENNTFRYVSIAEYMALPAPHPKIIAIQLGVLTRSTQPVGADSLIKDDQQFRVLDQVVTVKKDTNIKTKYVRQVVTQSIALRNALGDRGK